MPIEKSPKNPLPRDYEPSAAVPYQVRDGDDWYSVAKKFGLDAGALIEFNFKTRTPAEVNWYLRRNVGCKKVTRDKLNWMFSSDANPGTIYVPKKVAMSGIGPQCFAPAVPGSIKVDPALLQRNLEIEKALLSEAQLLYDRGDLRWFFTKAHGEITRLINENLDEFQRPDALLTLNIHFAEEFVRALWGQPHKEWQAAFRFCEALEKASNQTSALVGETEFCGARMADVHIHIDLSEAIKDVGCIPPEDYGNMLVFVNRGSLAALVKLRGKVIGTTEALFQYLVAPMIDLEVKTWRNTAYQDTCQVPVPDPRPNFSPRL